MAIFLFLTPIFLLSLACTLFLFSPESIYIWALITIINIMYIVRFFRCIPLFILFSFFMMYSFELFNFFINGYYISYWMDFQNAYYLNKSAVLNGLFLTVLGSMLFRDNTIKTFDITAARNPSQPFFYISLVLFLVCSHFGMSGDTILSVGYGHSEREKSALFEYSIVFYALALFFSRNTRIEKQLLWVMFSYFSVKTILYGGRIEVIQIALGLLYFQTNFFKDWSLKKLYSCIFFAFLFLFIIGRIRTDVSLIMEFLSDPMALTNFSARASSGVVSSNYGDVQHSSARMIGLVDTGIWELEFRLKSFFSYLFNIIFSGSEFKEYANLALKDQAAYGAGGGGLISAQFYVWLSWGGPIVAAVFLGWVIRKGLEVSGNSVLFVYVFMLLITFPRWYAYGPLSLVKICFITCVFYYLSNVMRNAYAKI